MKLNFARIAKCPTPVRIGLFVLALLLMWAPIALPISWAVSDRNLATILTMPLLYGAFLLLVSLWGRFVYQQPNLFRVYGFKQPRKFFRNLLTGLSIGLVSLFFMFVIQGLFSWVTWQPPQSILPRIILEGVLVALGYGFAEELLFRGWLLNELERGYTAQTALWVSSLVYALLHCIRPLHESIQFPALMILGMILVWAKRAYGGQLGMSIGLHAGLVWGYYMVNVGQLVKYSNHVPEWVTGVSGNPLAGMVGIFSLSLIAVGMRGASLNARRETKLRREES